MSADTSKRTGWAGWPFMAPTSVPGAGEPTGTALPQMCQCGGLHSRICERGTKGCTCQHDASTIEADGDEQHG